MLLLNTTASSLEKDHALEKKYNGRKPVERSCSWKEIQRPQALNFNDHALVEYNGLKPLNKPMLYTLRSQSLHQTNVRCISLKLLKQYHSSHGQGQDRLTLMNKPSEKRFAQSIPYYLAWYELIIFTIIQNTKGTTPRTNPIEGKKP